ncbi:hypothetical protein BASA61_000251 [Batrachochytrium salamandrivorans]|nr:hypothetical protein BASA61_000251 [Batrachochytrium salamandrivorans]
MDDVRASLPIFQYRADLVSAIREFQFLIVVGDTGSGKTTQLPQYVLEDLADTLPNIVVTQPRRIAAISAATRVSEEHGTTLGGLAGYIVRFEKCTSADTRLSYVTDGILLRQCTANRLLPSYDLVILDEAHERSLETDVLFGLLRRACRLRPTLKVVIMSATLDIDGFSSFFGDCPVFSVPGRMFTVDILWQKKMNFAALKGSFVLRCIETCMQIHKEESPGDILVFLTGQHEIETAMQKIMEAHDELDYAMVKHRESLSSIVVYPIYSTLESIDQRAIFLPAPPGVRKIVLATNIAQTSVTVPGIRYVIDSGFVKQKMYDPHTRMDALVVVPISQAAATQRAGRAGRTEHGRVYRLYSRDAFEQMAAATIPEIQRSSLLGTILQLKKMGINDVLNFEFIDPPDPDLVVSAIKQLFLLSAVDFHCASDVVTIVAMLSSEDVYSTPRSKRRQAEAKDAHRAFDHSSGDHLTLLQIYTAWAANDYSRDWCMQNFFHYRALKSARSIREQLTDIMKKSHPNIGLGSANNVDTKSKKHPHHHHHHRRHSDIKGHRGGDDDRTALPGNHSLHVPDTVAILKSLCTGFYPNTAKRHPARPMFFPYLSSIGDAISSTHQIALYLHQQSVLFTEDSRSMQRLDWVIYNDVQYVNRACMRVVSRIDFSMVEVLCGRAKLMQVERLLSGVEGAAVAGERRGSWEKVISGESGKIGSDLDGDGSLGLDVVSGAPVEFDVVAEVIDEIHHTEHLLADGEVNAGETEQTEKTGLLVHLDAKREVSHSLEEESRLAKLEAAKERFKQRKRAKR